MLLSRYTPHQIKLPSSSFFSSAALILALTAFAVIRSAQSFGSSPASQSVARPFPRSRSSPIVLSAAASWILRMAPPFSSSAGSAAAAVAALPAEAHAASAPIKSSSMTPYDDDSDGPPTEIRDLGKCDYLVVGSGAMGLAFVDALLALQPDATIVLVDRHGAPGGHWNDDYPFVRLHQPSLVYGVMTSQLEGNWLYTLLRKRTLPWAHRATRPEIVRYYREVVDKHVASGRLRYFPGCTYAFEPPPSPREGDGPGRHTFSTYPLSDEGTAAPTPATTYRVLVEEMLVDAVQGEVKIPATTPPNFEVVHPGDPSGPRIRVVTPNELPHPNSAAEAGASSATSTKYVVLGCGKTGMDTIFYLLTELQVAPENISWVISRDVWMINRNRAGPSRYHQSLLEQNGDHEAAMDELEAKGLVFRLDPDVRPTAPFRFPTVSPSELKVLRTVQNKVRRGRIRSISSVQAAADDEHPSDGDGSDPRPRYYPRLSFEDGTDLVLEGWDVEQTVFVRCTAPGPFNGRKGDSFYSRGSSSSGRAGGDEKLTLFPLFPPPVPQSGAALALVETSRRRGALDMDLARELVAIQQGEQGGGGACQAAGAGAAALDGLDALRLLLRPYYPGSADAVRQLDVHRNLAVLLAVADKDPAKVADWLSRGNRVSEYNWVSKLRAVENLRLLADKALAIGYTDRDAAAFRSLAGKLAPLEGR